jgi:hypothetical protein
MLDLHHDLIHALEFLRINDLSHKNVPNQHKQRVDKVYTMTKLQEYLKKILQEIYDFDTTFLYHLFQNYYNIFDKDDVFPTNYSNFVKSCQILDYLYKI